MFFGMVQGCLACFEFDIVNGKIIYILEYEEEIISDWLNVLTDWYFNIDILLFLY